MSCRWPPWPARACSTGAGILPRILLVSQERPIGIITGAIGGMFFALMVRLGRV